MPVENAAVKWNPGQFGPSQLGRVNSAGSNRPGVYVQDILYMGLCLLMGKLIQRECSNMENINFVSFILKYFAYFARLVLISFHVFLYVWRLH